MGNKSAAADLSRISTLEADPLNDLIASSTSLRRSRLRSPGRTWAPDSARVRLILQPTPRPAPVYGSCEKTKIQLSSTVCCSTLLFFYAGVQPVYLGRIFKQYAGKSFTWYINEYRIQHAVDFLTETEYSVTDICKRVGYNNINCFLPGI